MERKPRITMPLTGFDSTLDRLSQLLLLALISLSVYSLLTLPAEIPVHFSYNGQPDRYGNKSTLLLLPILGTVIYFVLSRLSKRPHLLNYMKEITADNALREYGSASRMIRFLKLAVLLIFTLIILFTFLTSKHITDGLGQWFLPLVLTLVFAPLLIFVLKRRRSKQHAD